MARMAFVLAICISAIGLVTSESPIMPLPTSEFSNRTQLKAWCTNVDDGQKLVIGLTDTTLQSACNLRTEITPVTAGSLVLAFAVLPLTEMVTPGSIYGTFMGMPKIYSLVNKTEEFTQNNLYTIRSVELDDIPLGGLRSYLSGSCGTVYIMAALLNGSDAVAHTIIKARMECPDETGVDLVPEVTAQPSWRLDGDNAILVSQQEMPTIPVTITIRNNGSSTLAARTDPDALRVWVYLKRNYVFSNSTIIPLNMSTFDLMPSAGDVMISIDNVINRTMPGSPAIASDSSVNLTLTNLKIPEHMCGDGVLVINVDPMGEIGDALRNNNVVGIRVRSSCQEDAGRCYVYGTSEAGVSLVALHHSYSAMPTSVVKLYASTAEIHRLPPPYMFGPNERLELIKAVALSHAIQAEANRLQDIGSCDDVSDPMHMGLSWDASVLARLARSLVAAGQVIGGIAAKSKFESEQLYVLSTMASTIGQLLQQKGSLRTILSTVLHGDMTMFSNIPGMNGTEGSGRYDDDFGGGGDPGQESYSGGHHRQDSYPGDYSYSGGYSGHDSYPGDYSYSGGYSGHDSYSGKPDYDYHGSGSGDYDHSRSGSGDYEYSGSGSGDYGFSGSGSGDDAYYGSYSGDYDYYGSGSGNYDYSGSGSGDYDYSGSGSGGYDYYGSGLGNSDYSGSGPGGYDYYPESDYGSYDNYGSSGDYNNYPDYSADSTDSETAASSQRLKRKKRFAAFPSITEGSGEGGSGMGGMGGMGHDRESQMMDPITRLELLLGMVASHVARSDYRSMRLPGCFPEKFNDNFRRFVKTMIWRTMPIQQISGYEGVSEEFVANVRSLIKLFSSGAKPAIFNGRRPFMFDERMERWIERRGGFSMMMPLPPDLLESALEEVVNISRNVTVFGWESDAEMRNKSMALLGKVASALLERRDLVESYSQAVTQIHALLATGELAEVSGTPGAKLDDNAICRRIVEMNVKKDAGGMNTPMLMMRDGDVYSVRLSPLTQELIWKKVVACECSRDQAWH